MTAVVVWWVALCVVSVANVWAWSWVAVDFAASGDEEPEGLHRWRGWQVALSGLFTFGCAFLSFLPRTEGERFCLFDGWMNDAPIARTVATVAELAFVAQVSLVLYAAARVARSKAAVRISAVLVPLIALAEVFSWYSALTANFLGSVLEESVWALTFTLALTAFALVREHFTGALRRAVTAAILIAAGYVCFMVGVDIPMYWHRWLRAESMGGHYLSIAAGWTDSWSRRVVTWRFEDWSAEMPWMSLYFSVAVWISISMAWLPRWLSLRFPALSLRMRTLFELAS